MSKVVAFDTETSGKDHYHATRPFLVTVCHGDGRVQWWEWDVDPLTREVTPPSEDVAAIQAVLDEADVLVAHSSKFDVTGLASVGIIVPWEKVEDTLVADHVLNSALPHNLTDCCKRWLKGEDGEPLDISGHEKSLEVAVKTARRRVKTYYPDWRVAKEGMADLPSAKGGGEDGKLWRNDYWLPRAVYLADRAEGGDEEEYAPWESVTRDYANVDSPVTLLLWMRLKAELEARELWKVYRAKFAAVPAAYRMEKRGVTINLPVMTELKQTYSEESDYLGKVCVGTADRMGYKLTLPRAGTNFSLDDFLFGRAVEVNGKRDRNRRVPGSDTLNLPKVAETDGGGPSFDSDARTLYLARLTPGTRPYLFVKSYDRKCEIDTGLSYLSGYERFLVPTDDPNVSVLHPNLNTSGAATTRWSHSNPNCFDGETELLTTEGWVRADALRDDHVVAQFDAKTDRIDFVKPSRVVRERYVGRMYRIKTDEQIDMLLTPEHRCLLENRKTGIRFNRAAAWFDDDHKMPCAGQYVGGRDELTANEVSWLCAVQADGSYEKQDGKLYGVRFVFKKQRKIDRMRQCLVGMGANFRERKTGDRTSFAIGTHEPCVVLAKKLMPEKVFGPWLLSLSRRVFDLFVEEVFHWDGSSSGGHFRYSSSIKTNTDWVQVIMSLSGHRSNIRSYTPSSAWSVSDHHMLNVSYGRGYSLTTNHVKETVDWNGMVYCVTVPTGYIVIRRNGKVAVTGNSANVSERSVVNARSCFCPAPGREWYSMDAANIELRIPAYIADERELIDVFERPTEGPYYGSYHLLIFDTLHPALFAKYGKKVKDECKSEYSCVKNGNFARQYGCQEEKADATYRVRGAYRKIGQRFPKIDALNRSVIAHARRTGGVVTLPDREVDPDHGYPIGCRINQYGRISSTVPFAYFVSGTAGWWLNRAVVKCDGQLEEWRRDEGYDGHMILSVHDELVYDLPLDQGCNLPRVARLRGLMQSCGDTIGIPTPVTVERHRVSWAEGEVIA